jgi:hypothetical protein
VAVEPLDHGARRAVPVVGVEERDREGLAAERLPQRPGLRRVDDREHQLLAGDAVPEEGRGRVDELLGRAVDQERVGERDARPRHHPAPSARRSGAAEPAAPGGREISQSACWRPPAWWTAGDGMATALPPVLARGTRSYRGPPPGAAAPPEASQSSTLSR